MDFSMSFDPVSAGTSLLGAIGNAVGGARQATKNRRHQNALLEKQQAWSEKMANQQNEWNLAQWNRENEYNSPVNQMSRYEAAGINPYNAVASGQIGSGTASSLQSATPNNVSAPAYAEAYSNPVGDFITGLSSSLDNALKVISVDREKKLTPSVVEKSENDARGSKGTADSALAQGIKDQNDLVNEPSRVAANYNLYQSQMHEFAFNSQKYALLGQGVPEIVANELAQMRSNTQILQLQAEGMGYDNKQKYAIAKFAEATEKAKLDQLVQQGELTKAQAENMRKQNTWFEKITMAQLANYAAQTAAAYGSADASHSAAGFSRAQTATENTLRRARGGQANETYRHMKLENDNYAPNFTDWLYHNDPEFWKVFGYGNGVGNVIGTAINGGQPETSNPKVYNSKGKGKRSSPRIRR
nr:MAG TPA: DNA pilot protein VP2 [Microviridae sp.]